MNASPFDNDEILLQQFAEGDRMAFEHLFNAWYVRLVVFAENHSISKAEAEEVVSDAFVKCWNIRDRFDALNKVKSFLYTTVRNGSIDVVRRLKLHPTTALEGHEADQGYDIADEAAVTRAEILGDLFAAIEHLPDKCREIVLLTYREGLSSGQIAQRLGISASTVTSQRARAVQLLKVALAEKYPFLLAVSFSQWLAELLSH